MARPKKVVEVKKTITAKVTRTRVNLPTVTSTYVVEEGVLLVGKRREYKNHFPFQQMKLGDSFLIPANDPLAEAPNGIHYAAKQFANDVKSGFMITTRRLLDKSRRVWRIK